MKYNINIRTIEPTRVAALRITGKAADAPKYMPQVFKSIRGKFNGAPFIGYLSTVDGNGEADMLLCVPTAETPAGAGIEVIEYDACREVYIKGPGMFLKGNPDNYITELIFPLED